MHRTWLLLAAFTLLIATLTLRAAGYSRAQPAAATPASAPVSAALYLGSEACASCHESQYAQWKESLHVRMTSPIAQATVVGDFSRAAGFSAHGRAYRFGHRDGRPTVTITAGGSPAETFAVDYTLGFKRYQGYLSTMPDGRMYVLPLFWHVETNRWIDWKEITPIPDGVHDLRQIWNSNCFNCHATNLAQRFDATRQTYNTTWTEMGIGCEACHGPGRRHVDLIEASRRDPTLKPGGTFGIYSSTSGTPRQSFDTCAYCHGNKQNVFVGFAAGDRYEDFALPFLMSAPIPETDLQGEYWPDGRPNRFNRPQALTLSGCFKAGQVACTTCHASHGSPYPFSLKVDITRGRDGDTLCTQCHAIATDTAIEQHTFHRADSTGSRCISCHMSDVNWRLLTRRRDHTFQSPVPEVTSAFGAPNACTTCHEDRAPEWAARQMDTWWRDGARRQAALALAETMYRAGSGDATVVPELAKLAIDRSQGLLVRASAVEFIEKLVLGTAGLGSADTQTQTSFDTAPDKAPGAATRRRGAAATLTRDQVNALIGAAADPEPTVRAAAINALLATNQRERIVTPIVARLVDPARVVRARAAEALMTLGVVELPGAAGEALARAQDEYAQALQDFPDVPQNHGALGWLEMERGRYEAAHAAIDTAIRLSPRAARPRVVRGVIAARQGRFQEAADWWREARGLEPDYPNIDRLIAEAEKRKGGER